MVGIAFTDDDGKSRTLPAWLAWTLRWLVIATFTGSGVYYTTVARIEALEAGRVAAEQRNAERMEQLERQLTTLAAQEARDIADIKAQQAQILSVLLRR